MRRAAGQEQGAQAAQSERRDEQNTFTTIAPIIVGMSSIAPKIAAEGISSAIPA